MEQIPLRARAKINLALDVCGRRPDGYHELRSVMQTVTLSDSVLIKKVQKEKYLKLTTNLPFLPTDKKNIAYKAASLLFERFGINAGVFMHIEKRIPVSAGLAGGSADSAAVLVGLRSIFSLPVSRAEMDAIALELGADVPFCLMRGTALAEGVGERLTRLRPMPHAWILLAKPPVVVSTADVFKAFDFSRVSSRPDIEKMLYFLEKSDLKGICGQLSNALESVTAGIHPIIHHIKETMLENGALGALMSGSGPTVFGIFETRESAVSALSAFRLRLPHIRELFVTRTFNIY